MRVLPVLSLLVLAGFAWADNYGWHPSSVDVGGQHVLTFRVGAGGMSAADRRAMVEFRMTKALTHTEYLRPVNMTYQNLGGAVAVYANGIYILTVTSADAQANNSTVAGLARVWGNSIKRTWEIVGPARQLPHTYAAEPDAPISLQ